MKLDPVDGAQRGFLRAPTETESVRVAAPLSDARPSAQLMPMSTAAAIMKIFIVFLLYEVAKVPGRDRRRTSGSVAKSPIELLKAEVGRTDR